jgi:cell division protein FtsI (penicillin-binding protein 3)
VAPRIVAATSAPRSKLQTVEFRPVAERRVIAPFTAAQMKQMMEGVVLHGTGRNANLDGYSAAGKTGTAQKFDPVTGKYSHTKFVASFAGFAPVNNPAVVVAVILDSPVAQHVYLQEGGWTAAPVFKRVSQQVLEYLHTPHDVELPASRQLLMARRQVKDQDLEEASPDRLGDSVEVADANPKPGQLVAGSGVVQAALRQPLSSEPPTQPNTEPAPASGPGSSDQAATSGTVVLEVEQGGIVVPSFVGKSVRSAIESAQDSGLDLDAVGSGVSREQSPVAGTHVAAGARVTVRFGR